MKINAKIFHLQIPYSYLYSVFWFNPEALCLRKVGLTK